MESKIDFALELLSGRPLEYIKSLPRRQLLEIDEIRLRSERPMSLSVGSGDVIVNEVTASPDVLEQIFRCAFNYSLHSYSRELAAGFITTRGGNRVGICGTAVPSSDRKTVESIKSVSSINIRIAREIRGRAEEAARICFSDGLRGVLVTGPPSSGKTTLLRDLTRIIGSKCRVSLIDEQNEIAAVWRGIAQNDVGCLTDVFAGYPKPEGVCGAIKTMSPRAVVVDEIGTREDVAALGYALHSGAVLITAVHAESCDEAMKKPAVKELLAERAFRYALELKPDRSVRAVKID